MTTTELTQKQITSNVSTRIGEMQNEGLMIAPNYSVSNALSSAYYALKNAPGGNLLEKCTSESIYNALLDMVTQGLSPAKTQCYFVPYGNTVKLTRSYFGTMKVVKQLSNVKDIYAEVIYEGDDFKIKNENGRKVFVSHETDWMNADNPIVGAYCIIEKEDGEKILTVMTKKEIDKSWAQAKTKNVQNNFPQEMAKRTVINRAAKQFFNTSDDNDLFVDAVNRTTENEYDNERRVKEAEPVRDEVETLDDILKAPSKSKEGDNVVDGEFTEETKTPPNTAKKTTNPDELKSTGYPEDEIPDFDQETGEVLEEISLFEGNTTQIKEQD
ncbi:recombinase RecT [Streptococcus suis]|uniref:recombinase RecT n=1 Tax=Streptococcus suis TaxID=1307 RepID=UPI0005CED930|nr:RecT family recombinase [Streptococcus suis]NQH66406.1 recombinase RecT [Streptococcus suis]CYU81859.1 Recombinational DNA repair protein RecT (prophage associated) [Streptococcus suis]